MKNAMPLIRRGLLPAAPALYSGRFSEFLLRTFMGYRTACPLDEAADAMLEDDVEVLGCIFLSCYVIDSDYFHLRTETPRS